MSKVKRVRALSWRENEGYSHTLLVKSEDAVKHINRIDFLFHHHISIDFRGVDVCMSQHLACGIDVTSCCQNECGEGMTAAVKLSGR